MKEKKRRVSTLDPKNTQDLHSRMSIFKLKSYVPCGPVAHAEHKDSNDKEFVKVLENGEDNLEDIRPAIWSVLRESERVGEDVKREVNVGLESSICKHN